jgi:ferric reductase like protein
MLHRWMGYVTTIQAMIHSIIFLINAITQQKLSIGDHASSWVTGSAAAIFLATLLPLTAYRVRRSAYEFFLLSHIALSVAAIVGTITTYTSCITLVHLDLPSISGRRLSFGSPSELFDSQGFFLMAFETPTLPS